MTQLSATFLTLFPEMVRSVVEVSILGRALAAGILEVNLEQIRDYAQDKRKTVDDTPCGGGPGQLMRVDVVVAALRAALARDEAKHQNQIRNTRVILLDPAGQLFSQQDAKRLSAYDHLVFVCGRYEGIDARIGQYVDEILSIGDFVLTGGELPALTLFDAVARCIPGVLGNEQSNSSESHEGGLLEASQYTRPIDFEGHRVPEVMLSGNHKEINDARHAEQLLRTQLVRPDLFAQVHLDRKAHQLLDKAQEKRPFHWERQR